MLSGCTTVQDYVRNGFKVGPNYQEPPTPVAAGWIKAKDWVEYQKPRPKVQTDVDKQLAKLEKESATEWAAIDKRIRTEADDLSQWWKIFDDPVLDKLVCHAYHQNLTLRQAAYRVLAARAQLGLAFGNFMPQSQTAFASFNRNANSTQTSFSAFIPKRFNNQFGYGWNLSWELDLWGKFRRAIESADASLDASVFDYDDVLVTLLSDVATNYVMLRVYEERIRYARENVALQQLAAIRVENRMKVGVAKQLDVDQVKSVLYQTWATIPQLEIGLRLANNQLCLLLGVPPEELRRKIGPPRDPKKAIPTPPLDGTWGVGLPGDLLRRRPDVRKAERLAAAQSALIGYAESDYLPHFSIIGSIGFTAEKFRNIFSQEALTGTIAPSITWNILSYGRILNNVRLQDATFQQLVAAYQNTVLTAQQEVENGLVTFFKSQKGAELQGQCVRYSEDAVKNVLAQYEQGIVDISQLILILQNLAIQQDNLAQVQGQIPSGLIMVYGALGGGWQLRETGCEFPGAEHGLDPLHDKKHFLPYPRVLKQSSLPDMTPPRAPADDGQVLPSPQPALQLGAPRSEPVDSGMPPRTGQPIPRPERPNLPDLDGPRLPSPEPILEMITPVEP